VPRLLLCVVLLWIASVQAAPDTALELRVTHLSEQLRCLVCQNQTIADSQAQLAIELKNQVREQLAAGRSERAVIDFMVQRYGDFVLYRPPLTHSTWLLWFGPLLLLVFGLGFLLSTLRAKRPAAADLAPAELARGAALLAGHSVLKEMP
jgi:cytochrome c-type biogenesis protein CcmH